MTVRQYYLRPVDIGSDFRITYSDIDLIVNLVNVRVTIISRLGNSLHSFTDFRITRQKGNLHDHESLKRFTGTIAFG